MSTTVRAAVIERPGEPLRIEEPTPAAFDRMRRGEGVLSVIDYRK